MKRFKLRQTPKKLFKRIAITFAILIKANTIALYPARSEYKPPTLSVDELVKISGDFIKGLAPAYEEKAGTWTPTIAIGNRGTLVNSGCITRAFDYELAGSHYCPVSKAIIFDRQQLQSIHNRFGDGGVVFVVMHEYAHHLQTIFEIKAGKPNFELMADCMAGHIISTRVVRYDLGIDKNEIINMAETAFAAGGGPTHGTSEQRIKAFILGYKSNSDSSFNRCLAQYGDRNQYLPKTYNLNPGVYSF